VVGYLYHRANDLGGAEAGWGILEIFNDEYELMFKAIIKLAVSIYLGVFLGLCGAWGVNLGRHVYRLYVLTQQLPGELELVQAETLVPVVEQAAGEVKAINQQLEPLFPVFDALQEVPEAGVYLRQVEPLLSYAEGMTQAGNEIATGLIPLLEESADSQTDISPLERANQVLEAGQAHFEIAAREMERAREVRSRIDPELLLSQVREVFLQLDENFDRLAAGLELLQIAPRLLGVEQVQSYLIMAQNRDELRATGGFITGIGLVSIQEGKILNFELGDSYQVDDFSKPYPTPPEPLKRFMLADYWVTRDANWSPDFPTAAKEIQDLFSMSTGVQTQGVIAFNQLAIERLLRVIGPVLVPEVDELVSAENVEEYMWQAKDAAMEEGTWQDRLEHRKDFMEPLSRAIVEKMLRSNTQEELLNLGKTIVDLLEQGQVLVYFNDAEAQALLESYGWDGGLHPASGDILYLVDSNVGFNKVDAVMQRSVAYKVNLSDISQAKGEVTLTYQHAGTGEMACKQAVGGGDGTYRGLQQLCYLDYWRVYTPGGSVLMGSNVQAIPADELLNGVGWPGEVESQAGEAGSQVFAGLLMVPIGKSSQVEIAYSLPTSILQKIGANLLNYRLRVQVQSGIGRLPVQLEVRLPSGATLLEPGEGWQSLGEGVWTWQEVLDRTTELNLAIQVNP
jgi:hypothetical protein